MVVIAGVELLGPGLADDDGIDGFEVRRVGGKGQMHLSCQTSLILSKALTKINHGHHFLKVRHITSGYALTLGLHFFEKRKFLDKFSKSIDTS